MKRLLFMLLIPLVLLASCDNASIDYVDNYTLPDMSMFLSTSNISGVVIGAIKLTYTSYLSDNQSNRVYDLYGDNLTIIYHGDNITFERDIK